MRDKYSDLIIDGDDSILDALKKMDSIGRKLLIVMEDRRFKSLISIGDIQRAIIKNIHVETPVRAILRREVTVASPSDDLPFVKGRMQERRNELMPIVAASGELVDVIFWEDLFEDVLSTTQASNIDLPVIIMAGGRGTRLRPLTNVLPKPLIPIREKTFIEEIMDRFVSCGCRRFYLSVNYKADMIRQYFSALKVSDYIISYFQEDEPLGTAGSLHLLNGIIDSTFFVTNCDIIIDQDYYEILNYHYENMNEITVVAALKSYRIPYGTLTTRENGLLRMIEEKPELLFQINTGFYILEPQLLNEIPRGQHYHITYLIDKVNKEGRRVGVFPVSEKSWTDIGSWNEYLLHAKI